MPSEIVQALFHLRHVSLQLAEHYADDLRKRARAAVAAPRPALA
jgi:hypothetical protein